MLIPTRSKFALPGFLSYPVGAEAISRALVKAPHVPELRLSFYNKVVWQTNVAQKVLNEGQSYEVLSVLYTPSSKPGLTGSQSMVDDGWYDQRWEIWVRPVLRERRHLANRLLMETGLPAVAGWLQSSNRPGWEMTSRSLGLMFDPVREALEAVERSGA